MFIHIDIFLTVEEICSHFYYPLQFQTCQGELKHCGDEESEHVIL